MTDMAKLARPYAQAAFEYAKEQQQVQPWQHFLDSMADCATDKSVQKLLCNPNITTRQLADVFIELGSKALDLDVARANFMKQLAENRRLLVLPEIAKLFEQYVNDSEKTMHADVYSVVELSEGFKNTLADALQIKFGRKVMLHTKIDPRLIGGLLIRANDVVIDNSIRSQLERMQQSLANN